ncbi:TPA: SDR family oxidoreductase [Candidatus Poribacteria bacterium]|nr:SDR family oxidoreductase [Candidatus Poribacteria bacterium]
MLQINLLGKMAVVTGASGELGRVMVRTLASCGADVAIHYFRNQEKASKLAKEVEAMGRRTALVQANVTIQDEVFTMQDKISATLGDPHIIVNNAVIQYNWTNVLDQEIEDYESQFQSCVLQNVLMAKAFIPAMIKANYGRVIGINTECAMQTFKGQSAYVSGKRGMDGVLRVLAKEVGEHQITVNQVAPGWTISDKDRQSGLKRQEDYESKVPLNRRGTDQEIANIVAFLASDLASYITGVYIPVCGGNVMPII